MDKPNWERVPPRDWAEEQAYRVGQEVRRLRRKRPAQWVADRTKELGYSLTRAVISDLEVGRRRYVTTAELMILARALDTAPIALMYPFPYYGEEAIQVLPVPEGGQSVELEKIFAVQWFTGERGTYLSALGMPMIDQENYYSQTVGLERARKAWALEDRKQLLLVKLRLARQAKREGRKNVTDDELDELEADIEDLDRRIADELGLGDRDLSAESLERMLGDPQED